MILINEVYVYVVINSKTFWETVIHPLTRKIGDVSTGSASHPQKAKIYSNLLQILAYQLFHR